MSVRVPFLDLQQIHAPLKEEVLSSLGDIIDRSAFVLGSEVNDFEQDFANFVGTHFAVGVASGLDALKLALHARDIGPGDEVVVPANTFIATAFAVSATGARPVLVDAKATTSNIDPEKVAGAITKNTKVLLPVHLYGQAAEMESLNQIANNNGLTVIEDAAQAHGAKVNGKGCGSVSTAGCFSFYPGKNLGSMGEGGAITTDDEGFATKIKMLRDVGQREKYHHVLLGHNSRLHTFQAAVLKIKLKDIDRQNQQRIHSAHLYRELLSSVDQIECPKASENGSHVYHLFSVHLRNAEDRDSLRNFLGERGIHSGLHYPTPIHLQPCYQFLGYKKGDFPVAEDLANRQLSLPIFPGMTDEQVSLIVEEIKNFYS